MAAAGYDSYKDFLKRPCPKDMFTNLCQTYLDGDNKLAYLMENKRAKPKRNQFIYFNDEAQLVGVRVDDWKVVFAEQLSHGFDVWRDPFVKLRLGKIFNLRRDPYERADTDSNTYNEWWSRRNYFLLRANSVVGEFLGTFEKYPPSQRPFKLDLDKMVEDIINEVPVPESRS
jgi:arylsulfatase